MFSWIQQQQGRLFASDSAARVAVYFSPESRDYLDKAAGTGLFATTRSKPGDELWWSDERRDSVYSLSYLAEYRGIIKWLTHNHVPFDIVVRPDAAELSRYQAVIAPALTALSDRDADLLDRYAATGGKLVITGPRPASLDELGNRRGVAVLKSLQRGSATHSAQLLGKSYLASGSPLASRAIPKLLGSSMRSPIETNAGKTVHMELRKSGGETLLHLVNPERLWNARAPRQRDVAVSIELPADVSVAEASTCPRARPGRLDMLGHSRRPSSPARPSPARRHLPMQSTPPTCPRRTRRRSLTSRMGRSARPRSFRSPQRATSCLSASPWRPMEWW
jgi:hypothetical protein